MRFRTLPNGDIFLPVRGTPPSAPEGYCQDPNNLFLYHPILDDCEFRVPFKEKLGCGKLDIGMHCDLSFKVVTGADCKNCSKK